ncbi:hypothetical protein [Kitasatospora phosalacinea]|uniref:hypothetical protein n=1 Tax=Kitasatospora phosalacinea TaxID=2065 RepID=UPI0005261F64|nr:hypothetical protein [Kitasatospora phosalacinea]
MHVAELISSLPETPVVLERCRALAVLDAILSPVWEDRYYSCDSRWAPRETMASMRDGCGNEYSIVFTAAGAFARGFDHESALSPAGRGAAGPWPGLLGGVPEAFRAQVEEPAFSDGEGWLEATVCFWREAADTAWRASEPAPVPGGGDEDGGAAGLFELLLDGRPEAYRSFAEEYYEVGVDLEAVRHVYAQRPLTREVVRALNPELDLTELAEDIAEIGYPTAG